MKALPLPALYGAACLSLFLVAGASSAEISPEQRDFFEKKIAPLLSDNCFKCHSAAEGKTKGGLAMDSRDALLKGGDDGKIVIPGDPTGSRLLQRVQSQDPDEKMPPKDAHLTGQQIADLTAWIKMGAPDPRTAAAMPVSTYNAASAKTHWAWQPVRAQPVPKVKNAAWVKTPVDNFILAKLEEKNMTPSPPADRTALIRRAYYDLIGLPPMPWEVQAFVDDKAPNAWEKVLDRLLTSPHYGERWGRYWLDVTRYSDTKGDAKKQESPLHVDAWTYRDYVVDAFNQDKPYDRFILEQIAADKLPLGEDKRPLAGLGMLTVGDRFNGNRNDVINDQIDVVTKGFQGLTVSCARCHDHMFDPIPQKDYYSLHGIFASSLEPKDNPIIAAQGTAQQYQEYLKAKDEALAEAKRFATEEMDRIQGVFRRNAGEILMAAQASGAERTAFLKKIQAQPRIVERMVQLLRRGGGQKRNPVFGAWFAFSELSPTEFAEKAKGLAEQAASGGDKRFPVNPLVAAKFKGKTPANLQEVADIYSALFREVDSYYAKVQPGAAKMVLASAVPTPADESWEELRVAPFRDDPVKALDGKEIATRLPNPLAQRFQELLQGVHKIEMTHPGAPKRAMAVEDASTPRNSPVFIRGEAQNRGEVAPRRFLEVLAGPERPEFKNGSGRLELAQAIASRTNPLTPRVMVNRIWLHHFGEGIVSSPDDFGTQSAPPSHPELLDYLSKSFMDSGWSVKRTHKLIMLSAVYQQNTETNAAFAKLDPGNRLHWRANIRRLDFEALRDSLLYVAGKLDLRLGGQPVNILSEPYSMRRSVYGYVDRGNLPEMMNHFDFANPGLPLGKRHETTVPQQALFMMNSPLMVEVSRKLLDRPEMAPAKTDAQKVHALYWMIYQRPPKPEEIELGSAFLASVDQAAAEEPVMELTKVSNPDRKGRPMSKEARKALRKDMPPRRGGGLVLENEGERVERKSLSAWEKYAHALLMANEAAYYN